MLTKVILFCCVGGQPLTRLFGKESHTNIKYGGGDEQSHTVEKVFGCGLLVDLFCFSVLGYGCFVSRGERHYRCSYCTAVVLFGGSCLDVIWDYD